MVKYIDNSGFESWKKNYKPKFSFSSFLLWLSISFLLYFLFFNTGIHKTIDNIKNNENIESNLESFNLENNNINLKVKGIQFSNFSLKKYKKQDLEENVNLFNDKLNFIEIGLLGFGTAAPVKDTKWQITKNNSLHWKNSDGVIFRRNLSIDNYVLIVKDEVVNNSKKDIFISSYSKMFKSNNEKNSSVVDTGAVIYHNSDIDYNNYKSLDKKNYSYQTAWGYSGFTDQYFAVITNLLTPDQTMVMKKNNDLYLIETNTEKSEIKAGENKIFETKLFIGPRDNKILHESNIINLEKIVDYGWFWFFAKPMLVSLNYLNSLGINYGIAIILLTILIRILMWPLSRKSYISMAKMQKIQPEISKLQKLYANDKVRLQMEILKLYQSNKTSPMSGLFTMILQIPIFFALYKALLISVPMRNASFMWISDLASMDKFFILPIIMGITMYLQQKIQSFDNKNDKTPAKTIMKWFPLIFTFMFAFMPAGLILYWTVSNLFSILQLFLIKKLNK